MSKAGAILDALASLAEGAVAGLTAERGFRQIADVEVGGFPRLFLTTAGETPLESVEILSHLQERTTYTVAALLYTRRETQEATLTKADAIRAALRADRTLGGLVSWSYIAELPLLEHDGQDERAAGLLVFAVEEPS